MGREQSPCRNYFGLIGLHSILKSIVSRMNRYSGFASFPELRRSLPKGHEPPAAAYLSDLPYYRWLVVGAVCICAFMGQVDSSIAQLLLPQLESDFGARLDIVSWVAVAYLVYFAAVAGPISLAVGWTSFFASETTQTRLNSDGTRPFSTPLRPSAVKSSALEPSTSMRALSGARRSELGPTYGPIAAHRSNSSINNLIRFPRNIPLVFEPNTLRCDLLSNG